MLSHLLKVLCAIQCKRMRYNLFQTLKNLLFFYTALFLFSHPSYFCCSGVSVPTHRCLRNNPLSSKTSSSISSTIYYYCHESSRDFPLFSCTFLKQLHYYLLIRGINRTEQKTRLENHSQALIYVEWLARSLLPSQNSVL